MVHYSHLFVLQDDLSSDSDADIASELKADYIDEGWDSSQRYLDIAYDSRNIGEWSSFIFL